MAPGPDVVGIAGARNIDGVKALVVFHTVHAYSIKILYHTACCMVSSRIGSTFDQVLHSDISGILSLLCAQILCAHFFALS